MGTITEMLQGMLEQSTDEAEIADINYLIECYKNRKKKINEYFIINEVCEYYGISFDEIMSKSRLSILVEARSVCYYILRHSFNLQLYKIAKIFNKNHATVMFGIRRLEDLMKYEKVLQIKFENICQKINK